MQKLTTLDFKQFISEISHNKQYKKILTQSSIVYNIQKLYIKHIHFRTQSAEITTNQAESISGEIFDDLDDQSWKINELKLFAWVTVCYAYLTERHVTQFEQNDWNFLVSVFPTKTLQILQYQAHSLIKDDEHSKNKRKWTNEQSDLLFSIIEQSKIQGKWNQISKLFYFQSNRKFFRSPQKCRQYWFNHLNPRIRHGSGLWSKTQNYFNKLGKMDQNGLQFQKQ